MRFKLIPVMMSIRLLSTETFAWQPDTSPSALPVTPDGTDA